MTSHANDDDENDDERWQFSWQEFVDAGERVRELLGTATPLRRSEWLSRELSANVFLKMETSLPTRSFKHRGSANVLLTALGQSNELAYHVVASSGGSHGLAVAWSCRELKLACTIFIPTATSDAIRDEIAALGCDDVRVAGVNWFQAHTAALEFVRSLDGSVKPLYLHPFAQRDIALGQGTLAAEILGGAHRQLADVDDIIGSVGGGGMLAGVCACVRAFEEQEQEESGDDDKRRRRIFAVETRGADCFAQSRAANKLVRLDAIESIATTLGARSTTAPIFALLTDNVHDSFVVDDRDAVASMRDILEHERVLVEPACACTIAALRLNAKQFKNRTVVVILCGSNISFTLASQYFQQYLS
jgi:threonine dehydratase